jgi:ABC-2 type transport system permease protein
LVLAPHRISFNILREAPDERSYTKSFQNVAILLEGEFESVFKNRLNPEVTQNPDFKYRDLSKETKMIVISDADIIRNKVNWDKKEFYALGYDRFTQRTYGNKEFIMNCMHYLLDDDGLINARSKEFRIRLLDKQRIEKEKKKWQILNTAFPIALVLLFGSLLAWIRKRKYAK